MSNCYKDKATFEVEFVTGKGDTVAVITLESKDVRSMYPNEILHARETKAAWILARGHRISFHTFFPMVVGVTLPNRLGLWLCQRQLLKGFHERVHLDERVAGMIVPISSGEPVCRTI